MSKYYLGRWNNRGSYGLDWVRGEHPKTLDELPEDIRELASRLAIGQKASVEFRSDYGVERVA